MVFVPESARSMSFRNWKTAFQSMTPSLSPAVAQASIFPRAYILFPAALVIAGDLAFGYFPAIRQLIFVLTPLVLLFIAGAEVLGPKGGLLAGAFLATCLYADVNWFLKPREDWQAAAAGGRGADSLYHLCSRGCRAPLYLLSPGIKGERVFGGCRHNRTGHQPLRPGSRL
jgi:hypothetical protein